MRIRPLLWFLGLIGTLAALSIAVGSGRIIHAQVYGSPPVPPNTNTSPPPVNTAPPIQVNAVNPPAPTVIVPPATVSTPPAAVPPITVSAVNPPSPVTPQTPPTIVTSVSGLPRTGVLSKVTRLVEQPLFELIVGVGILSALGIFFGWNARTVRPQQPSTQTRLAAISTAAPAATPAPRLPAANRPRTAGQPLPPLTSRLRPLGALRERGNS